MKLRDRDRRALWILAGSAAVILALHFGLPGGDQTQPAATADSVFLAEKRLVRLRQTTAALPGREEVFQKVSAALTQREKGLIQADTPAQAQAQLLEIVRRMAKVESLEVRTVEIGQVRPLGSDYGEVLVPVAFECRIDQLVNLLAGFTAQPEALASSDLRIFAGKEKDKTINVRMTVSGLVPRRLVPEKKVLGAF